MPDKVPACALVLAAGKGSRMGSQTLHKVCFCIDGVPAIVRALGVYGECGIGQNLVVVGSLAGQVVETVGKHFPNTIFAYQKEQNGTAGALKAALEAFPLLDDASDLLIAAGDRLIDPAVLRELFALYYENNCTLAMLALPTTEGSGSGRMILDENGEVLAILEMADVRKKCTLAKFAAAAKRGKDLSYREVEEILHREFSTSASKCAKAFPFIVAGEPLTAATILENAPEEELLFTCRRCDGSVLRLTPDEVEAAPWSNTSVYLVKKRELEFVLENLNTDNAQREEYLSDIAAILRRRAEASIRVLQVPDASKILGFNNPGELLEVSAAVRKRTQGALPPLSPETFAPVAEYLRIAEDALAGEQGTAFFAELQAIYGGDVENIRAHLRNFLPLLTLAAKTLPAPTPVALIRAPGRVNVMGRHVDHQGGNCNLMTINYETLMVAAPRSDDIVNLAHLNSADFSPCSFRISELVAELPWEDWQSVVTSRKLKELIGGYGVDWSHYVKAAVLRLQKKFSSTPLRGMDLFVSGNVPMAAGLSSSSSLVVGAAEAVCAVNSLDTVPAQLVTLCGESEWFVGTRGGSADHAAVKLGEKNKVVKVKFFDFGVEKVVPFPADYAMVLCDSGIQAKKAGSARDQFNHRVSCYKVGFELLKKQFPAYSPRLEHLRDVTCENLGVSPAQIYRLLLALPQSATRAELEEAIGRDLRELWSTHAEPADGLYPVRGVVLYGLAECRRSKLYADLLENGDVAGIGKLMRCSHDGDRVAALSPDGLMRRYEYNCDNASLLKLIDDLESGDPGRVIAAQLEYQPGGYRCSLPEIDRMVDVAQQVEGVVGAQLAGAGLGGCMMVFAKKSAVGALKLALEEQYYRQAGTPARVLTCVPIAGSGILKVK